jgi:xanthine dehydrogenase molybdopterin-binding subunit B
MQRVMARFGGRASAAVHPSHCVYIFRFRKRGLGVLATKFGISFTFQPMNQAGATVSVYLDGSVGLVHGGIEMGQGLHTKMCQVAAQALGVPLHVRVKVPTSIQHVHCIADLCSFLQQ